MGAKVYLAGSWKNAEIIRELARELEDAGLEVDAFCRQTDKRFIFNPASNLYTPEELKRFDPITFLGNKIPQRVFQEDKKWLKWCDTLVLVTPCGKSAHLEAGYAKGQGKRLYIYGDMPKGEHEVMYLLADRMFYTHQIELLKNEVLYGKS